MNWVEYKLSDILSLEYGKGLPKRKRRDGVFPVYGSGGIVGSHDEYFVKGAGIIVGRKGSIGTVYFEKEDFFPIDTTFYVNLKSKNYDLKFIYFLLLNLNLSELNSDSAVPGLNRHDAYAKVVSAPPLPTQRKIAAVLSAYDDLIENNTRRIEILEEMARAIYREWFVEFRFPGHEDVEMVDSDLGPIPEGWEVVMVGDKFSVALGGTPARKNQTYWENGKIPWIKSAQVNNLRVFEESEFITKEGLANSSTEMMPKRTTLIAITGATLGQVSLTEIELCANQSVVGVFDESAFYSEYIYLTFLEIINRVIANASGSAQQHINKGIVSKTKIILPTRVLIQRFNEITNPIFDLIYNLLKKNQILKNSRDILLPKLVSGEVDVSEIEIDNLEKTV